MSVKREDMIKVKSNKLIGQTRFSPFAQS